MGGLLQNSEDYALLVKSIDNNKTITNGNHISAEELANYRATAGLTVLYVASNAGSEIPPGIWIHVQRIKDDVTKSNMLYQFSFSNGVLYYRTGTGNGNDIVWTNIRRITGE